MAVPITYAYGPLGQLGEWLRSMTDAGHDGEILAAFRIALQR